MTAKEKLTALADAIREKTGETNLLSIDAMTALVKEIEVGGVGLPEGWAMGQFNTTAETMGGDFLIEHGLGKIPNVVIVFRNDSTNMQGAVRGFIRFNAGEEYNEDLAEEGEDFAYVPQYTAQRCFADKSGGFANAGGTGDSYSDGRKYFVVSEYSTSYLYIPAFTYTWIAIKLGG